MTFYTQILMNVKFLNVIFQVLTALLIIIVSVVIQPIMTDDYTVLSMSYWTYKNARWAKPRSLLDYSLSPVWV